MVSINNQELQNLITDNNPTLILFGEAHGLLEETKIQEKILEVFLCDVFMYELLENQTLSTRQEQEEFLSRSDQEDFSIISKNKDLKETVDLAKKFNLPLIGCDLENIGRKNTIFRERELTLEEQEKEEQLMKKRELVQFEKINKQLESGKKVFASVGIYHILPRSELIKNLKDKKVLIVYPIFKDGEIFGYRQDFDLEEVVYTTKKIQEYLKDEPRN